MPAKIKDEKTGEVLQLKTVMVTIGIGHHEYIRKMMRDYHINFSEALRRIIGKYVQEKDFALVYMKRDSEGNIVAVSWHPPPKPPKEFLENVGLGDMKFEGVIDLAKYGMTTADLNRLVSSGFLPIECLLHIIDRERAKEEDFLKVESK